MKDKVERINYMWSVLAGVIGAISMGALFLVAVLLKLSRLNIYRLIGSAILPERLITGLLSPLVGFLVHTIFGIIFALIFAGFISRRSTSFTGPMYGYVLWLGIMGGIFPFFNIAPAPWELGSGTLVTTILGFIIYGWVLGAIGRNGVPKEEQEK